MKHGRVHLLNRAQIFNKLNSIKRKNGTERPQTVRSEQNYKYVSELTCSQEGDTGSSRSPREMRNLTAISLSSGCCEKPSWTQTRHASGVLRLYRNIFLKISTPLSVFDFFLCRKKRRLKCYILCTDKHTCRYSINSIIWGVGFLWPTLKINPAFTHHCSPGFYKWRGLRERKSWEWDNWKGVFAAKGMVGKWGTAKFSA